jgi:uncharacterized Ntn-hydrolase superfamily protein
MFVQAGLRHAGPGPEGDVGGAIRGWASSMAHSLRDVGDPSPPGAPADGRIAVTYSIVARDPATGEIGAAVQSCYFAAGQCLSVEAGVGAIASQAFADPTYGALGLELLGAGTPAPDVLRALVADDDGRDVRQVAIVDARGGRAAHTGAACIPEAGQLLGDGFSVQANMMEQATVPAAMAAAYESAEGDLAARLLVALDAAQAEGGDFRGQQSAGLVVAGAEPAERRGQGGIFDIRVDDAASPLDELRRLAEMSRGYLLFGKASESIAALAIDDALREATDAARVLPTAIDPVLVRVSITALGGDVEGARQLIADFPGDRARLGLALRHFVAGGLVPMDDATLDALLR